MGSVTLSNFESAMLDFDLSTVNLVSDYNIIIHRVYDPDNNFLDEYAWFDDPKLDHRTLILLWHPVEMGAWQQSWIDKFNFYAKTKPYKIVYITGCTSRLDLDKFFKIEFDFTFMPCFDIRAANQWFCQPLDISVNKSKKFMCLNAKDVSHRRYILYQLYINNLLNQGTVSYTCTNGIQSPYTQYADVHQGAWFTKEQVEDISEVQKKSIDLLPILLDNKNFANALPRYLFADSYINIVGETDFVNNPYSYRKSFVTEKLLMLLQIINCL